MAEVKATEFRGTESFRHFKTILVLPGGETTEINLAPSPAPHVGEKIPLMVWKRKFGDVEYHLERDKWIAGRNQ